MKIIIDLPEARYKDIQRIASVQLENYHFKTAEQIIANGTPLPKGHGRLIDAREYENSIRKHYFDNSTVIRCTEIALDNAPTIIEADTESEDKA